MLTYSLDRSGGDTNLKACRDLECIGRSDVIISAESSTRREGLSVKEEGTRIPGLAGVSRVFE